MPPRYRFFPLTYSRARSSTASVPACTSATVGETVSSGWIPFPANSSPLGNAWRVTESCIAQFLGSVIVSASPGLPADGSPMITPRVAFRNATRKSSAAPAVAAFATRGVAQIDDQSRYSCEVREGAVEATHHVLLGERVDPGHDHAPGKGIDLNVGALERPAIVERDAARHADAALGAAGKPQQQVYGRPLLPLEHPLNGALPTVRRRGSRGLREHRVPDPGLGRDALDGEDLRKPLGPRHPHLVVLGVLADERSLLYALEQQRRTRDARPQVGGGDHGGLAVAQQGHQASQPAVEQNVRLGLRREPQVRAEGGIPIGPHAIPEGKIVTRLGPDRCDDLGALRGHELLTGESGGRNGEAQSEDGD